MALTQYTHNCMRIESIVKSCQHNIRDLLLLIFFSAITPYAYLWLMGYLVAFSPLQSIYRLFSVPGYSLVVISISIATILHSLFIAILLVTPFGYLISSKRIGWLLVFCFAVLTQLYFYPLGEPVEVTSILSVIDYLYFTVSMVVAFFFGNRLRRYFAADRGKR